jgi:hypothetical protein
MNTRITKKRRDYNTGAPIPKSAVNLMAGIRKAFHTGTPSLSFIKD